MKSSTHEVTIQNIRFNYYVSGTGPPLVFIPALHTTHARFVELITLLGKKYTVYYPDLPGIGTRSPLGHFDHTAANYGLVVAEFIQKLNLINYTLSGLCLGALIAVRAMQHNIRPKKLVLIEPLYDVRYTNLPLYIKLLSPIAGFLASNQIFLSAYQKFVDTDILLRWYFRVALQNEKDVETAVSYQVHQTQSMHVRAFVELLFDLFNLRLSDEELIYDTKTLLIRYKYDELIRLEETIEGMQKIFPNSTVKEISFDQHTIKTPLPRSYIEEVAEIMLKF